MLVLKASQDHCHAGIVPATNRSLPDSPMIAHYGSAMFFDLDVEHCVHQDSSQ